MSKAAGIRKKALEAARKQDWETAIREYQRLAEVDAANPNVYNELGDVYLKTGNKSDAYDSYVKAIDAYTRVSLFNNAVAVCKKVLRLIPARVEVLAKLGMVRNRQGITKEAEKHYLAFIDRIEADPLGNDEMLAHLGAIAEEMNTSPKVLERLLEYVTKFKVEDGLAKPLLALSRLYKRDDDAADRARIAALMEQHGISEETEEDEEERKAPEGAVITEENIWTDTHSDGERIDMDRDGAEDAANAPIQLSDGSGGDGSGGKSIYERGNVELPAAGASATAPEGDDGRQAATAGATAGSQTLELPPLTDDAQEGSGGDDTPAAPKEYEIPAPGEAEDAGKYDNAAAEAENESSEPDTARDEATTESIQVSVMMDDIAADGASDQQDYRSHYDLGMAYLEMNLFSEAIREYQLAAKSPEYQVRSLEMIGLCFLNQNQPKLAIKQLSKGLGIVGGEGRETLGLKYNLGLAYEMEGERDKARGAFEDVYVVDVTFRDVAEKIAKYSK